MIFFNSSLLILFISTDTFSFIISILSLFSIISYFILCSLNILIYFSIEFFGKPHLSQRFENLVNFDCKRISNALQVAVNKCVKSFDKNGEVKCRFEFVEKEKISPEQYLNLARMCRDIGMSIDINKLKEMTGLQFINEEEKDLWTPERLQD